MDNIKTKQIHDKCLNVSSSTGDAELLDSARSMSLSRLPSSENIQKMAKEARRRTEQQAKRKKKEEREQAEQISAKLEDWLKRTDKDKQRDRKKPVKSSSREKVFDKTDLRRYAVHNNARLSAADDVAKFNLFSKYFRRDKSKSAFRKQRSVNDTSASATARNLDAPGDNLVPEHATRPTSKALVKPSVALRPVVNSTVVKPNKTSTIPTNFTPGVSSVINSVVTPSADIHSINSPAKQDYKTIVRPASIPANKLSINSNDTAAASKTVVQPTSKHVDEPHDKREVEPAKTVVKTAVKPAAKKEAKTVEERAAKKVEIPVTKTIEGFSAKMEVIPVSTKTVVKTPFARKESKVVAKLVEERDIIREVTAAAQVKLSAKKEVKSIAKPVAKVEERDATREVKGAGKKEVKPPLKPVEDHEATRDVKGAAKKEVKPAVKPVEDCDATRDVKGAGKKEVKPPVKPVEDCDATRDVKGAGKKEVKPVEDRDVRREVRPAAEVKPGGKKEVKPLVKPAEDCDVRREVRPAAEVKPAGKKEVKPVEDHEATRDVKGAGKKEVKPPVKPPHQRSWYVKLVRFSLACYDVLDMLNLAPGLQGLARNKCTLASNRAPGKKRSRNAAGRRRNGGKDTATLVNT